MLNDQEPDWMHGGNILRCARKHIGMTQEEVCLLMDMNLATYKRWEQGVTEPDFSHVLVICEVVFKMDLLQAITLAKPQGEAA